MLIVIITHTVNALFIIRGSLLINFSLVIVKIVKRHRTFLINLIRCTCLQKILHLLPEILYIQNINFNKFDFNFEVKLWLFNDEINIQLQKPFC